MSRQRTKSARRINKRKEASRRRAAKLETLEKRQMLAADCSLAENLTEEPTTAAVASVQEAGDETATQVVAASKFVRLDLPQDLPANFQFAIEFAGQTYTLQLEKNSVFGENTRFLVDDGTGKLVEADKGVDRSYVGGVAENPSLAATAWLTPGGLWASVSNQQGQVFAVEPADDASAGLHQVNAGESSAASSRGHVHADGTVHYHSHSTESPGSLAANPVVDVLEMGGGGHGPGCTCAACTAASAEPETAASTEPITVSPLESNGDLAIPLVAAAATAPPAQSLDVLEFEVGVEIGSRAFFASSAYNGNMQAAMAAAQSIIGNLDARYLRGAGIKHKLGTVIIRDNVATDPLRDSVTSTGTAPNASPSLAAFRDYWNNNPQEVGTTHDLAIYHVLSAPSGLAYVNQVGTSNRYATSGGNGPTSWADGTAVHELGHVWNLAHVNTARSRGFFFESKPRPNGNAAGGEEVFVSVMDGRGQHNIGRLATSEADEVLRIREQKRQFGTVISNPGNVAPFGRVDQVTLTSTSPLTLDVVANDRDANNDPLDLQIRDTVSQRGGTITLSSGTGPGGRNELIYTPPAGGFSGTDFFHYNVVDPSGASDWGAVHITSTVAQVDLNATSYFYDLGTVESPLFNGNSDPYQRLFPEISGDIAFTSNGSNPVEARDRGQISGINDLNRDHIRMRSPTSFRHKIANGVYQVLVTAGDATENTNPMVLTAEGSVSLTTNSQGPADHRNYTLNNVVVTDGELNLDIATQGFSANLSRMIITRTGEAPAVVDLNATKYDYDFGTPTSPVQSGFTRISPQTMGDINWSGGTVNSTDRGAASGWNAANRDLVFANGARTLSHKIANGTWRVTMNVADRTFSHDNMSVRAEGTLINGDVDIPAGQILYVGQGSEGTAVRTFDVVVADGELNFQFDDLGGSDANWVLGRISLEKVSSDTGGGGGGTGAFQESGGQVVIEAENFTGTAAGTGSASGSTWVAGSAGGSSGGSLIASPNTGVNTSTNLNGPRLDYDINFTQTGTYRVFLRTLGSSGTDDSVHVGLNGTAVTTGSGFGLGDNSGAWAWVDDVSSGAQNITVNVTSPGVQTFNLWMREDGTQIDKIVLNRSGTAPTGNGPAESPRGSGGGGGGGGSTNNAPVVSSPIANVTVNEGAANTTINVGSAFNDPDGDSLTYTVVGNSNSSLVSTSISGSTLTLDYANSGSGSANITIRATDPSGASVDDAFTATVNASTGGGGGVTVDLSATKYDYDLGTATSPVLSGFTRITPTTSGDINWTGGALDARDRGTAGGNAANRDLIFAGGARTLNHKIANGTWRVTLNMSDVASGHDNMSVRAEGELIDGDIDLTGSQVLYVGRNTTSTTPQNFEVVVTDGELNLEFNDLGGVDGNWVATRLTLEKVSSGGGGGGGGGGNPPAGDLFQESGGQVVIEAENFSSAVAGSGDSWTVTNTSGASGSNIIAGPNNGGFVSNPLSGAPRADYEINFTQTGTYRVFLRTLGTSGGDDSVHVGLDGTPVTTGGGRGMGNSSGAWVWVDDVSGGAQNVTINVTTPGVHTFNVWMREDGTQVDKIVLNRSGTAPSGTGPAESPQNGTVTSPLLAAIAATEGSGESITQSDVSGLVDFATAFWAAQGISTEQLAGVNFVVADLGGSVLGLHRGDTIYLDDDAAGHGWYVDDDATTDEAFDGVDLFTTLAHELGHALGHDDLYADEHADDLMYGYLAEGERRASLDDLDLAFGDR